MAPVRRKLILRARHLRLFKRFPVRDAKMTSDDQEVLSLFLIFLKVNYYFFLFWNKI